MSPIPRPKQFLFRVYRWIRRKLLPEFVFEAWILRALDDRITNSLRPETVSIDGYRLHPDPYDDLNLTGQRVHEEFVTQCLLEELSSGDTVIDLGAHIGYYTVHFADRVGSEGTVFAFEPQPKTFRILTRNVRANNFNHVVLEEKAVLDQSGTYQLFGVDTQSGDYRGFRRAPHEKILRVEATTLDDYFGSSPPPVRLVKMDLQGAEGRALKGMENCLRHWSSLVLLTEYWPFGLRRSGTEPGDFLHRLESLGFELYTVEAGQGRTRPTSTLAPMEATAIQTRYGKAPDVYTNLLGLRGQSIPAIWRPSPSPCKK